MEIGFLHSLIRKDEKLLIEEFNKRKDVKLVMIDDRKLKFDLKQNLSELFGCQNAIIIAVLLILPIIMPYSMRHLLLS